MLSRKEQQRPGTQMPDQWRNEVQELLSDLYRDNFDSEIKVFEVYGLTYPDEVMISVSFTDKNNPSSVPVTYQVSADLNEEVGPEKLIKTLVDSVGIFFDDFFTQGQSDSGIEYIARWQEANFKGLDIYYKVSRENIGLTLMANELLKDHE